MNEHRIHQETGRVLFAAAAVWATVIAVATVEGVMAKFEPASLAAFGAGVSVFAWIAYSVDRELRDYVRGMAMRRLVAFALACFATGIGAALAHAAALVIFASPLAAVALAALLDRPRVRALRKASAKSPGARPASI